MAQVIFNEEWMVEYGLMLRTGLGARQIEAPPPELLGGRLPLQTKSLGSKTVSEGLSGHSYPKINQFIKKTHDMSKLPTGVEIRGKYIRIWFMFQANDVGKHWKLGEITNSNISVRI